jgi:hypothetical protein
LQDHVRCRIERIGDRYGEWIDVFTTEGHA